MSEEMIEITKPIVRYSRYARIGIFFTTLGLVILITAYGYGYFQLSRVNMTLASMIQQLDQDNIAQNTRILELNKTIETMQANSTANLNRLDVHDKVLAELNAAKKGDLYRWQIAEAEYLVKLARTRIMFTENNHLALPLLERAQEMLKGINDAQVSKMSEALTSNIAAIKAQNELNITQLYNQLIAIDASIDKLSLPQTPLATETKIPNDTDPDLSWWQKGLRHSADVLKQVVIIRRNENNNLPIVMPDEKAYLYQNLHLQVEIVILSLLHQNDDIYHTTLARIQSWIATYFVQNEETTQTLLKELQSLQKINLVSQKMDLSATLNLFEQYLKGEQPDTNTEQ